MLFMYTSVERKYSSINNHGIAMKPQIPEKMPSSLATELTRESNLSKALSNSAASSPAPLMVFDSMPKVPSISYNLGSSGEHEYILQYFTYFFSSKNFSMHFLQDFNYFMLT